jgi:hypothetical protein
MLRAFDNLPEFYQGIIYMFSGIIVLLYALGILTKGITMVVIVFSLYLVLRGTMKTGLYQRIVHSLHRHNRK